LEHRRHFIHDVYQLGLNVPELWSLEANCPRRNHTEGHRHAGSRGPASVDWSHGPKRRHVQCSGSTDLESTGSSRRRRPRLVQLGARKIATGSSKPRGHSDEITLRNANVVVHGRLGG
jgi:hypothetical protein